jgi:hypothetical integral membrane protein (TIGR02206 family)
VTIETFSPAHLGILAAIPAGAWALGEVARRRVGALRPIRLVLAAAIAVDGIAWYAITFWQGSVVPPSGLPLDLCDVVLFIVVIALVAPRPWALEAAYYLGLGGSGMALVTPDVGDVRAYAVIQFFVAHGAVVGSVLFLVRAGALRPRRGSWWRVFLALNAYAAAVLVFDLWTGTNYMYLREKPASGSLLDWLGPWPWYVLAGDALALVLLWLLELPFRRGARRADPGGAVGGRALG